jgi:hypothetical protein
MKKASSALLREIPRWFAEARKNDPASFSIDGKGLRIYGDVGGAGYIRLDGTVFTEPWDEVDAEYTDDPNLLYTVIVVGAKTRPALRELLPDRPQDAMDCRDCGGTGWVAVGGGDLVCGTCHGLGWKSAA